MVNQRLLEKSLNDLGYDKSEIKSVRYNKDILSNLFNEYSNFKMEEEYYSCTRSESHCWIEVIEEGTWDMTLEDVKKDILRNVKRRKKFLYNGKKYGSNRLHIYKNENECYLFIYLRDILCVDYNIWFSNEDTI